MVQDVIQQLRDQQSQAQQRLCDFLRIASVSTDSAYAPQITQAARWVDDHLRQSGFEPAIMETEGHPVVVARSSDEQVADPSGPRMLFYGHYDVQPPDPIEQWTTPPFEPTIRNGAVYARGAVDDKGQVMCMLEALRAYKQCGLKLPGPITVMIEGEEECGSVHLGAFIKEHWELLAADVVIVSDTSMWTGADGAVPAITYALRGLVYFDIQLHGPNRDLHSGVYGGTLANPATILTRVLGELFDKNNRITIPGFYDDVAPVSDDEQQRWGELGFRDEHFLGKVDAGSFGEAGFDTLQRRWARPACDVNGLYGGYQGEGAKTVIPCFAGAKVSFRIPANMKPNKVADQFEQWLGGREIGDCCWRITCHGQAAPVATPLDSPFMVAASDAIESIAGRPPVLVREGATIPVVADFKSILGLDTLLIGFGLDSDQLHAPDEHFGLDRLLLGSQTHVSLLATFAKV
jgi:acetylornithine deacetylase/succinyl-diaminopimelate desuccinylase-like protein